MANWLDAAYSLSIGPHYLWHRYVTGKYGPRTPEKTGEVPDRFKGAITRVIGTGDPHYEPPCLWLHAVSVGEVQAARALARGFLANNPLWELRVSTTTATGRQLAEKHFGAENVFYYPLDFSWMVRKTFKRVRPSLIVLMELEIWPNFLRHAHEKAIPVAVANARITERSIKRLARIPSIARDMAWAVDEWYAQNETYAERLRGIGVPENRIGVLGSIKYDSVPETIDEAVGERYRRLFGCPEDSHVPLLVAGSTHPGEDEAVLEAWKRVAKTGPAPRLVLVPRHPERLAKVEALARSYGSVVRRSALPDPAPGDNSPNRDVADIVLGDTMGELAHMYSAADLVFIGGTLTDRGGQNFLEPCGLGKCAIVGPNLWNFQEPADLLIANDCLTVVADGGGLAAAVQDLLHDPDKAARLGMRAREVLLSKRGATKRTVERLDALARKVLQKMRRARYNETP